MGCQKLHIIEPDHAPHTAPSKPWKQNNSRPKNNPCTCKPFVKTCTGSYRFAFQGQEKDDEVKGTGNSINFKYRMHDPRLGRFFAVDPLAALYPFNSPYAFAENKLGLGVELEGLELRPLYSSMYRMKTSCKIKNEPVYHTQIVKRNVPLGWKPNPHLRVGADGQDHYSNYGYIRNKGHQINQPSQTQNNEVFDTQGNSMSHSSAAKANGAILFLESYKGLKKLLYNTNVAAKEGKDRSAYYKAINIVNENKKRLKKSGYKEFTKGKGYVDLINFLNDGTVPQKGNSEYLRRLKYLGYKLMDDYNIPNRGLAPY